MTEKLEREEYSLEIDFDSHRGIILLPQGVIDISWDKIKKQLNFEECEATDLAYEVWLARNYEVIIYPKDKLTFTSGYIEYLYPGSPGYGLHIKMPTQDWRLSKDDFYLDYSDWYSEETIKSAYEKYVRICEAFDNLMSKVEEDIRQYASDAQCEYDDLLEIEI